MSNKVRLRNLAQVQLGQEDEEHKVFYNGQPVVAVQLIPQPNSNHISISKLAQLVHIQKTLPKDIKVHVALDKSIFIKPSIQQVY